MILIRLMTLLILAIAIALCHGGDNKKPWKSSPSSSSSSLRSGKSSQSSSSSDDGTSCPDGSSTDEGEVCRTSTSGPDTFNGGCSGGGNSGFSNITFGESICGTVSNYEVPILGNVADTDWYYFEVSTNTTVSVRLTTDFDAQLYLFRLGDGASCQFTESTFVAQTDTDIGNNTYVISTNVTAGDYTVLVTSQSAGDSSLFCFIPGNYTVTVTDGPIP